MREVSNQYLAVAVLVGSPARKELLSEGVDPRSVPHWDLDVEEMKDRPRAVVL